MTTTPLVRQVAGNVRAEMARQKITQTKLANDLRMSQPSIARRLGGHVAFDIEELATIAALLNVSVTSLIGDEALTA